MNAHRRFLPQIALAVALAASALFAQGPKRQQTGAEYWMKLEKELGLQTEYAVDMEIETMGMLMPSKTYRLKGQTRSEMTMPIMNLRMVALELLENGKAVHYALFPDKKKYCINEDAAGPDDGKQPDFKLTDAGTEVYEGVTCKKRHLVVTTPEGQVQEMDMLFSPQQKNMPVKMTATVKVQPEPGQEPMAITSEVRFKNYVFAPPAASLFAIPKDYAKAKDMNEIMMGSFGGFGLPQAPAAGQGGAAPAAGQPDLGALLRQAQEQAAKEEAAEAAKPAAPAAPPAGQDLQQGIQNLRKLFGN